MGRKGCRARGTVGKCLSGGERGGEGCDEDEKEIDGRVGERLRSRRLKMGLSQTELGAAAGVTFQQVQKYEKGANRISAGRIIQFAERLGVAPAYFVEGFGGGSKANGDTINGPRHRISRRQQRGCGGVGGDGADEARSPQIHGDAGTSVARDGVTTIWRTSR